MDPPSPDSSPLSSPGWSPPSSPEPPPWAVPWEGEGEPLPVLVGVAAPVVLRGETERLLRDLGRSRPLPPSLKHLKRVRGGPGGAAVLLCLEEELGGNGGEGEWGGGEGGAVRALGDNEGGGGQWGE